IYELLRFFFQAEDGIRDATVTGVQTCALPIWRGLHCRGHRRRHLAGFENRLSRRRNAFLAADGAARWRHRLHRGHRRDLESYEQIGRVSCRERVKVTESERRVDTKARATHKEL